MAAALLPPAHPLRSHRLACVSTPPAVEIDGLVKSYRGVPAVAGLSLTAGPGRVTAILGPNGAGKTTTIETCEGYRRPDGGSVRVLGLDPVADARALRPRVGVMLQAGGVPTTARAAEYLKVMARFYRHPLDPGQLLDRLGLAASARTRLQAAVRRPAATAGARRRHRRPPGAGVPR